jgi:hypothetical protein
MKSYAVSMTYQYRAAQKPVTVKYYLVWTVMSRLKPAIQSVEQNHIVVSCALNMKDRISNNFHKFNKKLISNVF